MRHITTHLTIGDANDGRLEGDSFDRVVALASASDTTTHEHLIRDGEHDYDTFKAAVTDVIEGLEQDESVLVHCNAGLSRSVAVAIAALVIHSHWDYDKAYEACRSGFIYPDEHLIDSAKQCITELSTDE